MARIHADQIDVPVDRVAALVADQFPAWAGLPVRPVPSDGTETSLFRVGDEVVVRFPLLPEPGSRARPVSEQAHARTVAAATQLSVPVPLGVGEPAPGYPWHWSAWRWIDGRPAIAGDADVPFATDLARFVRAVHAIGTHGARWRGSGRGGPLARHDRDVRDALAASGGLVDVPRLTRVWRECSAPGDPWPDVTLHGDLMPGNLLVRDDRLAAVIDLGVGEVGDPAVDLMPAWNLFADPAARDAFRTGVGADDETWRRGRGWALMQAIVALPYYVDTLPAMADTARRTLQALLE